jgi:hypothetical protein
VYVGCGWGKKLLLHWARLFKEVGSKPPQVIGFAKHSALVGQIYGWKI